jgi:hypothetical protein
MSSTPLNLPALRQLADEGFNMGVLALLEHRALSQAIAVRELKGFTAHPSDEVKQFAQSLLPQGAQLYTLYTQTRATMDKQQLQDLEAVARNLSTCAASLETSAARVLVLTASASMPQQAAAMQVIGERYAQLMEAAQELERSGVVSVSLHGRLASLTTRPDGPLSPFHDKACAILAQRERSAPRMRATA